MTFRGLPVISSLDSEEARKFRTFSNYVRAISALFRDQYGDSAKMVRKILTASSTRPTIAPNEVEQIEKCLARAWATEGLMCIPFVRAEMEEIAPSAALWLPVQTYYAVYSGLESALLAHGHTASNHTRSLNMFSDQLRRKSPTPLDSACSGDLTIQTYDNFQFQPVMPYSTLKGAETIRDRWTLLGVALRTTREKIIKAKIASRKAEYKKKNTSFPRTQRALICSAEAPTTILHFLYRLRLRSNYGDSEVFISGSTRYESLEFGKAYVDLADYILGVFEVMVEARLGAGSIETMARSFLRRTRDIQHRVARRWSIS